MVLMDGTLALIKPDAMHRQEDTQKTGENAKNLRYFDELKEKRPVLMNNNAKIFSGFAKYAIVNFIITF